MALMTPEERAPYLKKGYYYKNRCDNEKCKQPIRGMTYCGTRGEYCSRGCLHFVENPGLRSDNERSEKEKEKRMASNTEETSKKKKKKLKTSGGDKPSKKKGDEAPKKKKADDGDEKPKKSSSKGPFKSGSGIGQIFEKCLEGTTMEKLEKFADKIEVNLPWALQHIRKNEKNDFKWKFIHKEETGRVKVIMK